MIVACFALGGTSVAALADTWPQRPITIIVIAAGGAPDLFARLLAPKLGAALKQPIIVEARPGAGGNVAAATVARAAPDGHTILMHSSLLAIAPSLYANLPYDPRKDLAPIAQIATTQMAVLTNASLPVADLQQFIGYAGSSTPPLNYGSAGNGTIVHMAVELFKRRAGIDLVHIPYKGSSPELLALLANEIQVTIDVVPVALPHVKSGRMRALAITSPRRSQMLPGVPTTAEAGLPGLEIGSWNGLFAPAKTPPEIVARLNQEIRVAMSDPSILRRLVELGAEPTYVGGDAFRRFFDGEIDRWARVVKETGIRID